MKRWCLLMTFGAVVVAIVIPLDAAFADDWPQPTVKWRAESQVAFSNPVAFVSPTAIEGIIVGDGNDIVRLDNSGNEVWRTTLIDPSVTSNQKRWARYAVGTPALADLDGDGGKEIISHASHGEVVALDADGEIRWRWPGFGAKGSSIPIAADLDGDGRDEILAPSQTGWLACLNHDGTVRWRFSGESYRVSMPSVADVDGDGALEVLYGVDQGKVFALRADGSLMWVAKGPSVAEHMRPWFGRSRAMVTDGDGDGRNEVYILASHPPGENFFFSFDAVNGRFRWKAPTQSHGYLGVGIADLDGDGDMDMIVGGKKTVMERIDVDGNVVWNRPLGGNAYFWPPTFADLNNDGVVEIIQGVRHRSTDGLGTSLYIVSPDGDVLSAIGNDDKGAALATLVADLDGNGRLEIVSGQQHLTAWEYPLQSGKIVSSDIYGFDALRLSTQKNEPPPDSGPDFIFSNELPTPHYGDNRVSVRVPERESATTIELSIKERSGPKWTRLFVVPSGTRSAELIYPINRSGRFAVSINHLDTATGEVIGQQSHRIRVRKPFEPISESVESAVEASVRIASTLESRSSGAARYVRHQAAVLRSDHDAVLGRDGDIEEMSPEQHDALFAEVAQLLKKARRLRGMIELAASSDLDLVVWEDPNPWDTVNPLDALPNENQTALVDVWAFGNETESRSVHLLNIAPGATTVRLAPGTLSLSGEAVEGMSAEDVVGFKRVISMPTKYAGIIHGPPAGERVPDLLPELGPERLVEIASGQVATLWLDIRANGLSAGEYRLSWPITTLEPAPDNDTLKIALRVSPVSLPEKLHDRPVSFHAWIYPQGLPDERQKRLAPYLRQGGANVACLSLPRGKMNTSGTALLEPLDWTAFDRVYTNIGPLKYIMLPGFGFVFPQGTEPSENDRHKAWRTYGDAVFPHLAAMGIRPEQLGLYPKDEPALNGEASLTPYMNVALEVTAADPRWQLYANPGGAATFEQMQRMAPVTHVWQPTLDKFIQFGDSLLTLMRADGEPVWFYEAPGESRTMNPLGHYRMYGWSAFRWNLDGWGFWVLLHGNSQWNTTSNLEPQYTTLADDGRNYTHTRRWLACRDATEDVTAFMMLREQLRTASDVAGEEALKTVKRMSLPMDNVMRQGWTTSNWDPDWNHIQAVRLEVEQALSRLRDN